MKREGGIREKKLVILDTKRGDLFKIKPFYKVWAVPVVVAITSDEF